MRKVLIANRGEIAVRIARACRDAGLTSVAVYADPDRDALHTTTADEAHALHGTTPADTYLNTDKILAIATRTGADAIHPGYGFLAENADFAHAVTTTGLTWIGPPPTAITTLGDKIQARHIAHKVGAPLTPGTPDPVTDPDQALAFARHHGLPIAIKAAHGGGGRGLKVARTLEEIPAQFDSAVREATAAFGRGECFVERYLDRPRHVETQCLADTHGTVVVVSTRDCTLQRRHQKLVEEAPAPHLTPAQDRLLRDASKAILREAGYTGAGTCEFLIGQDGTVSFLEVNTRLQVEHPVTEEITGIDLVTEMLRIADGHPLGYDDPAPRGHSIEFRINAEDPGRDFLPAPGTITTLTLPGGPGIRVDTGYQTGDTVPPAFDSLIAKLVVTGATRTQALARARRALTELHVGGMPTATPFHQAVLTDPAFAPTDPDQPPTTHTRWIETEFDNRIEPYQGIVETTEEAPRQKVTVEVDGRRVEVTLPAGAALRSDPRPEPAGAPVRARRRGGVRSSGAPAGGDALTSPMQGTIVKVTAENGRQVTEGDTVVVIEAMKMEQPLTAHKTGTVTGLTAEVGAPLSPGETVCEISD